MSQLVAEAPAAVFTEAPPELSHPAETAVEVVAGTAPELAEAPAEPVADHPDHLTFDDLQLRPELLEALAGLGYEEPTPVQREAIPVLLTGQDVVGQAATGTGKTAAFALPVLEQLTWRRGKNPTALVLVPTRELAVQVAEAFERYGEKLKVRVLAVYGGAPVQPQLRQLERGVDIVVATPGRAIDHLNRGSLSLDDVRVAVLDEADEMLDMGFAEDIEAILGQTPDARQTVLFSATMPPRTAAIAKRHLTDPVRLRIAREETAAGEAPRVRQTAYLVSRAHKAAALGRVLDVEAPASSIVFCRTRGDVDALTEALNARGYRAEALHGGMSQDQRDKVMARLRAGTADLLVATDVAARGLDVDQLTHVVNYDVPAAPESYVHRIGRVGRVGREGVALTLADPREQRMLSTVERVTGQRIEVRPVPSVADLRAARLQRLRAAVLDQLGDAGDPGALDDVRAVVRDLAGSADLDPVDVAAAALRLAATARGEVADEQEIPSPGARGPRRADGAERPHGDRPERGGERPGRGDAPRGKRGEAAAPGKTRLFIGVGQQAGVRVGDLVGAIANETGLTGKQIGPIDLGARFSLVDVPDAAADDVIAKLSASTIKGRHATVRRERF
jgi:ATP-dependent RNA helicase DeaD